MPGEGDSAPKVARVHGVLEAEHVDRARDPGEAAGDGERKEVAPAHGDAAVRGRFGVEPDRAHPEAERRPVQDQRVDDERGDRDEDPDVEPREGAPPDPELRRGVDHVRARQRARSCPAAVRRARTRYCPPKIAIQLSMIVVITSWAPDVARRNAGDPSPDHAAEDPGGEPSRTCSGRGRPEQMRPDEERRHEADPVLALAADVEQAAPEGECDRQRGQDQRRRHAQRLLEVLGGRSGARRRSPTGRTS